MIFYGCKDFSKDNIKDDDIYIYSKETYMINYIETIEQKVNLQDEQAIKYLEKINIIENEYIEKCLKN